MTTRYTDVFERFRQDASEHARDIEELATVRLREHLNRMLAEPVRLTGAGDLLPEEKSRLLATVRALGVPAEDVVFDRNTRSLRFLPDNIPVVAEDVP